MRTHTLFWVLLPLLVAFAPWVQAPSSVVLLPESRVWIDGSSSINTFTCEAGDLQGEGHLEDPTRLAGTHRGAATATLRVPVRAFDCGRRLMNRDLYQALKGDAHPYIYFRLGEAGQVPSETLLGHFPLLRATGHLTIAGSTRRLTLTLMAQRLDQGRYRAWGEVPLLMSDFGITPPKALYGLIQAHDEIVVRFNLMAAPAAMQVPGAASSRNTPYRPPPESLRVPYPYP